MCVCVYWLCVTVSKRKWNKTKDCVHKQTHTPAQKTHTRTVSHTHSHTPSHTCTQYHTHTHKIHIDLASNWGTSLWLCTSTTLELWGNASVSIWVCLRVPLCVCVCVCGPTINIERQTGRSDNGLYIIAAKWEFLRRSWSHPTCTLVDLSGDLGPAQTVLRSGFRFPDGRPVKLFGSGVILLSRTKNSSYMFWFFSRVTLSSGGDKKWHFSDFISHALMACLWTFYLNRNEFFLKQFFSEHVTRWAIKSIKWEICQ